jgi:hypothetical protein
MVRGGRGGGVRLKVYLSMSLIAVRQPYDVKLPARVWAEMLDLPDPEQNGARRVADAIDWLEHHRLIAVARNAGAPADVRLLSQLGDGGHYSRPSQRWVNVPVSFWQRGWIATLSGKAVALLLVLLDLQGGRAEPQWIAPRIARERYELSPDTWTRATKELSANGLLSVGRTPQGEVWDWRRLRNTYWVDLEALDRPPP